MVQAVCGLREVGGPVGGELGWGEVAVGGVGTVAVVADAPVAEVDPGFQGWRLGRALARGGAGR